MNHPLISTTIAKIVATVTSFVAIATVIPATGWAQEPVTPPEELAEFRETFEATAETRSAPALEAFASGLEQLARSRAESGDYEGAIRARDRRSELLESLIAASGDAASREGEIVIDLPSASRIGSGLKYDEDEGKFIGFTKDSQTLRWELSKTEPGIYSAIVTYSCAEPETDPLTGATIKTGGSFTLEEVTSLTTSTSRPLRRTVLPTGGWDKSITRNIGKFTITGSQLTLLLSVSQSDAGGLMHLYGIRLVPFDSGVARTGAPLGSTPAELTELRDRFRKAIELKTTPLIMTYGSALRAMLEAATEARQLEAASQAKKEFITAEKLSKDPTLIIQDQPGS